MTIETPQSPPAITYEHKVQTLAAVLIAETGGKTPSLFAVAQVIANRGGDPYAIVTKKKQFSCLNKVTPERLIRRWITNVPSWYSSDALSCARSLLHCEKMFSIAAGTATHYHSTKVHPAWARGKHPIAVICGHKFYKLP